MHEALKKGYFGCSSPWIHKCACNSLKLLDKPCTSSFNELRHTFRGSDAVMNKMRMKALLFVKEQCPVHPDVPAQHCMTHLESIIVRVTPSIKGSNFRTTTWTRRVFELASIGVHYITNQHNCQSTPCLKVISLKQSTNHQFWLCFTVKMQSEYTHTTQLRCVSPARSQASEMSAQFDFYSSEHDLACLYVEIMDVCQPFYALPRDSGINACHLAPRLEDGLANALSMSCSEQENPQDPMATCYQCTPQRYSTSRSTHTIHFHDR